MRKIERDQLIVGEVNIADIKFDSRSRDEIPKVLKGLQQIYINNEIREKVFDILEKAIPSNIDKKNGRPGMDLWKILVLGVIRLSCDFDYDKTQEMANQHNTLRQMLGHNMFDMDYHYPLQTIKDNIKLLTPEIIDEINKVVVEFGHSIVKKKKRR